MDPNDESAELSEVRKVMVEKKDVGGWLLSSYDTRLERAMVSTDHFVSLTLTDPACYSRQPISLTEFHQHHRILRFSPFRLQPLHQLQGTLQKVIQMPYGVPSGLIELQEVKW